MKALSIKQPWAWLICAGYKDIENRGWFIGRKVASGAVNFTIPLPMRIYVHAGKTPDDIWPAMAILRKTHTHFEVDEIMETLIKWEYDNAQSFLFPQNNQSLIIGEVDILDCVTESDSPWFVGEYGFVLANPKLYDKPIPYRGQLGFFEVTLPNTQEVKS